MVEPFQNLPFKIRSILCRCSPGAKAVPLCMGKSGLSPTPDGPEAVLRTPPLLRLHCTRTKWKEPRRRHAPIRFVTVQGRPWSFSLDTFQFAKVEKTTSQRPGFLKKCDDWNRCLNHWPKVLENYKRIILMGDRNVNFFKAVAFFAM